MTDQKIPSTLLYSEEIQKIALEAAEKNEFVDAVRYAKSQLNAISKVRELLKKRFPRIAELPKPQSTVDEQGRQRNPLGLYAQNDFLVAKAVVDLLSEELTTR